MTVKQDKSTGILPSKQDVGSSSLPGRAIFQSITWDNCEWQSYEHAIPTCANLILGAKNHLR